MPEGLHGPETCPVAPAGCEACSGFHHWLDDGCDPTDPASAEDERYVVLLAYDREHGTEHAMAFFGCKHCSSWATCEYVWGLEEDDDDDCGPDLEGNR